MWAERGVNSAKPLFSHTKITGRPQSAARLTDSLKWPACTAPSPKNTTATWSPPASRAASALPSASGTLPPTTPVAPIRPCSRVHEVHRPAEPAAEAVGAAHQLGQHALDRRALGERVAVGAVPAVHGVVVAQLRADRRRHALLAHAQVDQPEHLVGALELAHALLEQPDQPHRAEQAERVLAAQPRHQARTGSNCAIALS